MYSADNIVIKVRVHVMRCKDILKSRSSVDVITWMKLLVLLRRDALSESCPGDVRMEPRHIACQHDLVLWHFPVCFRMKNRLWTDPGYFLCESTGFGTITVIFYMKHTVWAFFLDTPPNFWVGIWVREQTTQCYTVLWLWRLLCYTLGTWCTQASMYTQTLSC